MSEEQSKPNESEKLSDAQGMPELEERDGQQPTWITRGGMTFQDRFQSPRGKRSGQNHPTPSQFARDRTKTLLLLALALVTTGILFLGIFSTPVDTVGEFKIMRPKVSSREQGLTAWWIGKRYRPTNPRPAPS